MSDRMDKDAMEKFYNYMKAYYPPTSYPLRNPYYSVPQQEDKERKSAAEAYPQMYGYPPYSPYQMPPMGYPQPYGEHEQDKRDEDKPKHDVSNPYAHYYPYSHYPYYNPYSYPPYYYGQRDYPAKNVPPPPPPAMPATQPQHAHQSLFSFAPAEPAPMKMLSKPQPQEKAFVKEQIVISSDSEQANEVPPAAPAAVPTVKPTPPPSKPDAIQQQKPQRKEHFVVNIEEEVERDPFLIRKKQKIAKEEKEGKEGKTRTNKALKHFAALEKEKQINTRYAGMPSEAYQEMIKKQTRIRLELFYERERQRKEEERLKKDSEKEIEGKDLVKRDIMKMERMYKTEMTEKLEEKKGSSDDKSQKEKKEKASLPEKIAIWTPTQINRITAPLTPQSLLADEKEGSKRERIRDDHPLKELRYNQSHGRIRLGGYFQSNIPTLMRYEDLAARRVELQKKLREREISAITF